MIVVAVVLATNRMEESRGRTYLLSEYCDIQWKRFSPFLVFQSRIFSSDSNNLCCIHRIHAFPPGGGGLHRARLFINYPSKLRISGAGSNPDEDLIAQIRKFCTKANI